MASLALKAIPYAVALHYIENELMVSFSDERAERGLTRMALS